MDYPADSRKHGVGQVREHYHFQKILEYNTATEPCSRTQ